MRSRAKQDSRGEKAHKAEGETDSRPSPATPKRHVKERKASQEQEDSDHACLHHGVRNLGSVDSEMRCTNEPEECPENTEEEASQELRSSRSAQPTENGLAEDFAEQLVDHFASGMGVSQTSAP
jgi:hypothetical protein